VDIEQRKQRLPARKNAKYDELIFGAAKTTDQAKRAKMLHDAEKILMDEMVVMPIYFYVNLNVYKPTIKGVSYSPLGFVDFTNAYVIE